MHGQAQDIRYNGHARDIMMPSGNLGYLQPMDGGPGILCYDR